MAIYLLTCHKKGISSLQLSRDLNITQKNDAENFAVIMNRIARVPVSPVPPRKPKDTSKPAPENKEKKETDDNKPSSDKE